MPHFKLLVRVGYRGSNLGHIFRTCSSHRNLMNWCILTPFVKKRTKKMRNPGCPTRKTEESNMAAFSGLNLVFLTLMALFEMLFLLQMCYIMFLMPRNPFLKVLWNFNFSFLRNGQFWSKCGAMALFVIFRRFSSVASSETYTMKDYHNLDLSRKFEHSSFVSLTAVPVFVL